MKKKKSNRILLIAFLLMVAVFALVTVMVARSTYEKKVAEEKITEPDFYSMTEFSKENSEDVMKALKSGSAEKLGALMIDSKGAENVIGFADWAKADFDNAVSFGAGSFSTAPDKKGRMDISERFVVSIGEQKYVLYIETLTSRHGMNNEGVKVVAATTYEHFDQLYYAWNGNADESSAVAGESFVKQ
ncbi:MAG: hypothetical protein IJJ03_06785 [Mogibacterium sp.]|nr:hypothetical protein [Mogibacterium sp.]MBQ6501336.1 hypothetical protein [Mogibacterium sp.]